MDKEFRNITPADGAHLQKELAGRVRIQPLPSSIEILGAADIAYSKTTDRLVAVILTLALPGLEPVESAHCIASASFPYIPGLLSFREVPPLIEAFGKVRQRPDVLLCDGHGIAHPRRFGLASHLGVSLGIPTVGCAKSLLCGDHEPLQLKKGNSRPLFLDGEEVGLVYCSREGVKPIYISPGHLSDMESSKRLVSLCLRRFRIPEPLRLAHIEATRLRGRLSREPNTGQPEADPTRGPIAGG